MFCLLQSNGQQPAYGEKTIPIDFQEDSCNLLVGYAFHTCTSSQCSSPDKKNRISKTDFQGKHASPTWKITYTSSLLCKKSLLEGAVFLFLTTEDLFIVCLFFVFIAQHPTFPISSAGLGTARLLVLSG